MKNIFKNIMFFSLAVLFLAACEKDENQVIFEGGTAPVLTASSTSALVLRKSDEAKDAVRLSWTNPNYMFNTGVSSQNVSYILQIAKAGTNFADMSEIAFSGDLRTALTVKALNAALLGLDLAHEVAHDMEFRIKSSLGNNAGALFSNVVKINVTPYLDVVYPVPAKLFIVGSATPGDWGNPVPENQELTKVNDYTYEITLNLKGGGSYLFLPTNGQWDKYGYTGGNNGNNPAGDNFKPEGGDMLAPADSGRYKITVDFKTGKFTVAKV